MNRTRPPLTRPTRWAIKRHLAGTLLVLVGVVALAVVVAERLAAREVLQHAEVDARTLASQYVAPLAADDLHHGDSRARAALSEAFTPRLEQGSLLRIKIWAPDPGGARIVYSDRAGLEGEVVRMNGEQRLFGTTDAMANTVEPGDYDDPDVIGAVEVYVGFLDSKGSPFIFEAYMPVPTMASTRDDLLRSWLPVIIGSLVLLTLAGMPLTVRMARRIDRAQDERRALLSSALEASDSERQRLSRRLHDGVIQDLAGVGMTLDGIAERLDDEQSSQTVAEMARLLRRDLAELRSVGEKLFADDLKQQELVGAVAELVRTMPTGSAEVSAWVDPTLKLTDDLSLLAFRIVREGLRNAVTHAKADHVEVRVEQIDGQLVITVRDDGVGIDVDGARHGHWGLRMLQVAAVEAGGSSNIESAPHQGTELVVRLELPAQPPVT